MTGSPSTPDPNQQHGGDGAAAEPPFDPTQVPVFPVLTLQLTEDGGARVNGRDLPVAPGQDPTEVAVAAAADEARLLPGDLGAIRVRGVDADGHVFPMVVRADGAAFDLPTPPTTGSRPRWVLPLAAGATVVALGAGVVTFALTRGGNDAPRPRAAAVAALPGAGANLPVLAPPGYAQRATWSVPITDRIPPIATPTRDLVAVSPGGELMLLDDLTGRRLWTGNDAPSGGPLSLVVDRGRSILATATAGELTLWPLPDPRAPAPAAGKPTDPVTIPLPPSAEVSFAGSAPLVTLPDQTAALVTQGSLARVDVPVGSTALAADADSVIAAGTSTTWYDLTPGAPAVARKLRPPPGATGRPAQVLAAGSGHLVTVWATPGADTVALHDLATGRVVATASTAVRDGAGGQLPAGEVLRQEGGQALAVGSFLVRYGPDPAVIALPPQFTAETITTGHVYGQLDGRPADAVLTRAGAKLAATPAAAGTSPGEPTESAQPFATTPDHAYLAASKVEAFLLYAVPAVPADGGNR